SFELPARSEIEALARQAHERLRAPGGSNQQDLAELTRILLGPVLDRVEGNRIAIVADGALQYLPFSALPVPATDGAGTVPLIVEHEVVALPSASVLREIRRVEVGRPRAPGAVAILADPVYESADPRVRSVAAVRKAVPEVAPPSAKPDPATDLAP